MNITKVRPLSWQAVFILKRMAKGCYVRRGHGVSPLVFLHETDGTEIDSFSFSTVTALETRGLAVRSPMGAGWRWDITDKGKSQVEAWQ